MNPNSIRAYTEGDIDRERDYAAYVGCRKAE